MKIVFFSFYFPPFYYGIATGRGLNCCRPFLSADLKIMCFHIVSLFFNTSHEKNLNLLRSRAKAKAEHPYQM